MKAVYKHLMLVLSMGSAALCMLPVMSTWLFDGGKFGDTFYIEVYNLIEFSAWGCVPLFAPLLIPVILYGSQTKDAKELELIFLFSANMICYVHSFNAARTWLDTISDSLILYYPGRALYPLGFMVLCIVAMLFVKHNKMELQDNDFDEEPEECIAVSNTQWLKEDYTYALD